MLTVKNLKKHFGGVKAVNNCSFKIKEGKITALIGPNGSGKSTIFNLISGLIKEDEGQIFFKNEDTTNYPPQKVSNTGISRLFQKSQMFGNLTIKENLLLALDNEDTKFWKNLLGFNKTTKEKEKKIREGLDLIGMRKFENTLGRELSYGQKRLVEIIRTILNPHELLVLDEPVAGVNPTLRNKISNLLKDLKKKGSTVLLIEHDMDFALNMSQEVIVLDEGKVIAQDTPKKIKNDPKVLEAYLGD